MSDRFIPISMKELTTWVFTELKTKGSLFNIPKELFFKPGKQNTVLEQELYGHKLETPFGVAAGPHTQMAQNIISSWLCGARFIELKTVQTLDELDVSKPCIDLLDVGYNVEWSQELKLEESFDEYLRAWVLIHALHNIFNFPGKTPGMIFSTSVGYNFDGILQPNVQRFLKNMQNAGKLLDEYIEIVANFYPEIRDIDIPYCLSNNVTLSTMHGCPPEEIGKIASYLIQEMGFNTNVKLNPTLLGPEKLRDILNNKLGYREITVPDIAFEHDLKYPDAILLLKDLLKKAEKKGITFGVKLSNTLKVENHRTIFDKKEKMMYLSGRPLHALTVNLAQKLSKEFNGELLMSFAGGADCFNVGELLRCGMKTITVSSDILRPGGFTRILQYTENAIRIINNLEVSNISELICKAAKKIAGCDNILENLSKNDMIKKSIVINLDQYGNFVITDPLLHRDTYERISTKTSRELQLFDCIKAPCTDECPVNQKVPEYIKQIKTGEIETAIKTVREDNPLSSILSRSCNHQCELTCTRTHYDEPLAIRELKRFIIDKGNDLHTVQKTNKNKTKISIIGAGPCGLSAAYFLAQNGYQITLFEEKEHAAGMVSETIPAYRATSDSIEIDLKILKNLGVEIKYGQKIGRNLQLSELIKGEFKYNIIAVGAQKGMPLGIQGENSLGVIDGIAFLRKARNQRDSISLGSSIGVIGAGDVAMDCARVANRLSDGNVTVIYRRTIEQMPAHKEELDALLEEGISIKELASPKAVISENGKITALKCTKMKLGAPDSSGRKRPVEIPNSDFEISLDNLIVAIGQLPDFSFFDNLPIELNKKGYINVDNKTLETSVKGIYAGGDAIQSGPLTIVKACGDGKIIAESIRKIDEPLLKSKSVNGITCDVNSVELLKKRAHRVFRYPVPHTPIAKRNGFSEIIHTFEDETAIQEAERCLECDTFCNTCVTVCPNKAIFSYKTAPFEQQIQVINTDEIVCDTESFSITQSYQTAIFTPFCNECANCATFCPTSGKPFSDKPRLYNKFNDFEKQSDNAFMIFKQNGNNSIKAKFNDTLHELILSDVLLYSCPEFNIKLDKDDFKLINIEKKLNVSVSKAVSLKSCAIMYTLLKGITESMTELPVSQ